MPEARILIVEDEQLVAGDIQEILTSAGYTVISIVTSGEEAITQVVATKPDLVLMDIRLAGAIDGIQASESIQSQLQIPVVYLTANADQATLERVKASKPFGYLLKPFDERTLLTTIDIALSRHRAETAVQTALAATEAKVQSKSEHLSMMFHELRNPIAIIKLTAEALQRQIDLELVSEDKIS
jgi:AmiR/NasT family two-component response regulator